MNKDLNCNQISALINFYLEGKLTPRLKSYFEQHLEKCPNCAKKIKELKKILNKYKNNRNCNVMTQKKDNELILKLSAYLDNELDTNENIKIKKMTISNQKVRQELETMYKFKKMIHSAYEKTRQESKFDYSRALVARLQDAQEYSTDFFYKLSAIFVILLCSIIAGFIYLHF